MFIQKIMNNIWSVFAFIALSVSLPTSLKANVNNTPNWDSLNIAFEQMSTEHINAFDFVSDMEVLVDKDQTDWAQGNIQFGLTASSKELNLISSPDPQFIDIDGGFILNSQTAGADQVAVDLDVNLSIKGEIAYLLRHINAFAVGCSDVEPSDVFASEFCVYAQVIDQNDQAKDWQPALEALKKALLSFQSGSPAGNGVLGQVILALQNSQVSSGADHSKINTTTSLQAMGLDLDADVELKVTNDELSLRLQGQALLSPSDYQTYKNLLGTYLVKLQQNDQDAVNEFYNYSFLIFGLLEGFLA